MLANPKTRNPLHACKPENPKPAACLQTRKPETRCMLANPKTRNPLHACKPENPKPAACLQTRKPETRCMLANPKTRNPLHACLLSGTPENLLQTRKPAICCVCLPVVWNTLKTLLHTRRLLSFLLPLLCCRLCFGFIFPNIFIFFPIADASRTGGTPTLSGFLSFPLLSTPAIVSTHFRLQHTLYSYEVGMHRCMHAIVTRLDLTRLDLTRLDLTRLDIRLTHASRCDHFSSVDRSSPIDTDRLLTMSLA